MIRIPRKSHQLYDHSSGIQNTVLPASGEVLVMANAITRLENISEIVVEGCLYLTPGAGCTGVIIRVREHFGLTGTIVLEPGNYTNGGIAVTAGKLNAVPVAGSFNPGILEQPAGGQHTVSVEQLNATAAGSILVGGVAWFSTQYWDLEI